MPTRGRGRRRGLVLLEVVIALGILLMALAVVGAAMHNSLLNAERAELMTRAVMMTEQLLTTLDTAGVQPEREQTGTFAVEGDPPGTPPLTWKLELNPDEQNPELLLVTATVYLGDPEQSANDEPPLLVTHTLRPVPRPVNLKNDFGMTDEQITLLTDSIPGGEGLLDPEAFDPTSLARLDMDMLAEMLPAIMAAIGGGVGLGGDAGELMQQLQQNGGKLPAGLPGLGALPPGGTEGRGSRGSGRGSSRGGEGSGDDGGSRRGG